MLAPNKRQHRIQTSTIKTTHKKRIAIPSRVEDLLADDDVNSLFIDLNKEKPHIFEMLVVWLDKRDKRMYYQMTKETHVSTATWLLESTKLDLLNADMED